MTENTRAFYRVDYPVRERPVLHTKDDALDVIECSESGLSYALHRGVDRPLVGASITGIVRFGDRAEATVEGVVVRVDDHSAALRLTRRTIPFAIILGEQKYLRRHYHARYNR